uniref:Plant bHLH transcription factor ACT-like domain-containing protein n=2 Tax=Zea mays TaxID=4577 RepID=A0A804RCA7_MAIZE
MEMGDSFEYYWEMQQYLESEELRYATPDATAIIGFGRESSDSIVRNLPSLQPLHGHPGRCPVLLRLQLAGWLHLQLVLGAGGRGGHGVREAGGPRRRGGREQEHPHGARPPAQAQREALRAAQRRAQHHKGESPGPVRPSVGIASHCQRDRRQMDKASIIKDAIEYIEQLQAEERRALQALEAGEGARCGGHGHGEEARVVLQQPAAAPAPVEVLELRVSEVGDRVLVVNVTCSKGRDAMARVCRAVEELRLRVITASVTSVAGCLMHTIFVEVDSDQTNRIQIKHMIEAALAQLDDASASPPSVMSYY